MEEFYKFLVDNGILFRFIEQVNKENYSSLEHYYHTIVREYTIEDIIYHVNWSKTPEGFHYWRIMSAKWETELLRMKINKDEK